MTTRAPNLRALLRTTTTTTLLRSTPQLTTRTLHNSTQTYSQSHSHSRSRSPSPPPPYTPFASLHNKPHHTHPSGLPLSTQTLQWTHTRTPYTLRSLRTFTSTPSRPLSPTPSTKSSPSPTPTSSPASAEAIEAAIETIQDLYGTARDEFEIAAEETEKNTTYAADDRGAAREELDRLLEFYGGLLAGEDRAVAEEVKRRVGGRIRELEQAVIALEESVTHGD